MKLSIVIPVYNTERYLNRCLDSVINQLTDECEIILVDDGSTDNCPVICDEYANNYKSVVVIHQENQGLSAARNAGIETSNGDYLMFLDSDDWIENDTLCHFIEIIDKYSPDLINGRAKLIDDSGECIPKIAYYIPKGLYNMQEYYALMKQKLVYTPCAPFTLCKRKLITEKEIRFKRGILHEDTLWTPLLLINARNIYCTDKYFYYNYVRQGSITHSGNRFRSGNDLITVCYELRSELMEHPELHNTEALWDIVARKYLEATVMIGKPVKDNRAINAKELVKYSYFDKTKKKAKLYKLSPMLYIGVAKFNARINKL